MMTEKIAEILQVLLIDKDLSPEVFDLAGEVVEGLAQDGKVVPIWLKALANGNRGIPEQVREFVVIELCIAQLQSLGYRVKIERMVGQ